MAKITTKNLYLGDSFMVRYRCWRNRSVQQARTQFGGTEATLARDPLQPVFATVRLVNFETNETIPLGDLGVVEGSATIDGNELSFTIPSSKLSVEGTYRVYTRIMVDHEQVKTEVIQFRVLAIS